MTEFLRRGAPGMKSVKDMPIVQDGPPPGGAWLQRTVGQLGACHGQHAAACLEGLRCCCTTPR